MKYTTIIGILLVAIGIVAAFVGKIEFGELITESSFALGILYGGGIGMLLGGFLGWLYKNPYAPANSTTTTSSTSEKNQTD